MAVSLDLIPDIANRWPIDMMGPITEITKPLYFVFVLFPVLTVAYRNGWKKGVVSLLLVIVVNRVCTFWFGAPAGIRWMLAAGVILLAVFTVIDERTNAKEAKLASDVEIDEDSLFMGSRVSRINKSIIPIALLACLIGMALNFPVLSLDPPQGALYAAGMKWDAIIVLVALGVAFFPMKFTSALVSGSMITFSFFDGAIALLMPNWIAAGIAVAAWKVIEVYFLVKIGLFINRYPFIRSLSDDMRTSIYNVMEIGLLIGSAVAAEQIAPGWGFMLVPAAWWINNYAGAPVVRMGIGPITVIAVGILANLFKVLGI